MIWVKLLWLCFGWIGFTVNTKLKEWLVFGCWRLISHSLISPKLAELYLSSAGLPQSISDLFDSKLPASPSSRQRRLFVLYQIFLLLQGRGSAFKLFPLVTLSLAPRSEEVFSLLHHSEHAKHEVTSCFPARSFFFNDLWAYCTFECKTVAKSWSLSTVILYHTPWCEKRPAKQLWLFLPAWGGLALQASILSPGRVIEASWCCWALWCILTAVAVISILGTWYAFDTM